jgi:hypothetical protein
LNLQDETKNQHFISQSEQRLNASNPKAKDVNKSIFEFHIADRENHVIELASKKAKKINKSLSLNDLYSFDVLDKSNRLNFEKIFHKYECQISENINSLLEKLENNSSDIKNEVLHIFISKFSSFIRNPFSIEKVLNTFPALKNLYPTDPVMKENFNKILDGRKPQQGYLCKDLGITEDEYKEWLAIVFLTLSDLSDDMPTFLESMVKDMYECKSTFIMICVHTYDDNVCLLSDRGYSMSLPPEDHMSWDFNLTKNSFIRYLFSDIENASPEGTSKKLIEAWKSQPKNISLHHIKNDLDALKQYNQHVVYQAHKSVLSASEVCYGL